MTTFETAIVGDEVFDIKHGWGVVVHINKYKSLYPIQVSFKTNTCTYTYDGKSYIDHIAQSLFWDEVVITPPPKPLAKLAIDTKVLVWNSLSDAPEKRYFSHFNKEGKIVTFSSGRTSWSGQDNRTFEWNYWELEKEGIK